MSVLDYGPTHFVETAERICRSSAAGACQHVLIDILRQRFRWARRLRDRPQAEALVDEALPLAAGMHLPLTTLALECDKALLAMDAGEHTAAIPGLERALGTFGPKLPPFRPNASAGQPRGLLLRGGRADGRRDSGAGGRSQPAPGTRGYGRRAALPQVLPPRLAVLENKRHERQPAVDWLGRARNLVAGASAATGTTPALVYVEGALRAVDRGEPIELPGTMPSGTLVVGDDAAALAELWRRVWQERSRG